MDQDNAVTQSRAGTVAQDHSVAAGAGGVAVGRDVHGDVVAINFYGVEVRLPTPAQVATYHAALACELSGAHWSMDACIERKGRCCPSTSCPATSTPANGGRT